MDSLFLFLTHRCMSTILDQLFQLADEIAHSNGLYVVDVEVRGHSPNQTVWIYLDAESGHLSLEQCTAVSKELGLLIEAHELFSGKYRLNVSSPGLDKPLKDIRQYRNNIGRKARVKFNHDNEIVSIEGKLDEVDDVQICIDEGKSKTSINLHEIIETKIIPAF